MSRQIEIAKFPNDLPLTIISFTNTDCSSKLLLFGNSVYPVTNEKQLINSDSA